MLRSRVGSEWCIRDSRRDDRARQAPGLHAVRPASATEVHCGAAQGRTRDEEDELALWSVEVRDTYDEITGVVLPPSLVQQSRAEEVMFMLDGWVRDRAPGSVCA